MIMSKHSKMTQTPVLTFFCHTEVLSWLPKLERKQDYHYAKPGTWRVSFNTTTYQETAKFKDSAESQKYINNNPLTPTKVKKNSCAWSYPCSWQLYKVQTRLSQENATCRVTFLTLPWPRTRATKSGINGWSNSSYDHAKFENFA